MIEEKKIDVGPILGNNEADEKVKQYMAKNNMFEEGWHWSGSWWSDFELLILYRLYSIAPWFVSIATFSAFI